PATEQVRAGEEPFRGLTVLWPFPLAGAAPGWLIVALSVVDLVIRVLALGIIPGNRRPTTAMAWLLGIFFVPSVGLVLFLLFGNFRLSRRRERNSAR
ncbi:cardiolipin synthetase, partial [Arthrobacter sp. Hiyo6]